VKPHPTPFQIQLPHHRTLSGWAMERDGSTTGVGILHGLGDHAGRYHHVGAALLERGHAVEALDLPGHGLSYGPRGHIGSWREYRDAVTAWLDRDAGAHPDRRWALLGHSMGAMVALDWAFAYPDRIAALVLSGPPFELAINPSMLKVRAAQVMVRFWPRFSQGNMILPSMLSHDQTIVREHMEDPLVHYRISARLFFELQSARATLGRKAPDLRHTTLVLHGGSDHVAAANGSVRWVRAAPQGRATVRVYSGLYHEVLNEVEREPIIASMADWIDSTLRS
jgi:acylglycerol lipase